MKLHVHELDGFLTQTFVTDSVQNIEYIRLHLYVKHGTIPEGSILTLHLLSENVGTVAVSEPVIISEIPGPYFHGLVRFKLSKQIKAGTYTIMLTSDFTFDEAGFVGWCSDYDFNTYPADYDYSQALLLAPKRYEVWALKNI